MTAHVKKAGASSLSFTTAIFTCMRRVPCFMLQLLVKVLVMWAGRVPLPPCPINSDTMLNVICSSWGGVKLKKERCSTSAREYPVMSQKARLQSKKLPSMLATAMGMAEY